MLESPMFEWSRKLFTRVLERIRIQQPSAQRNLHPKLVLFIPLAMQRSEPVLFAFANCTTGPEAVSSGGG
jgi:hypothetical protein